MNDPSVRGRGRVKNFWLGDVALIIISIKNAKIKRKTFPIEINLIHFRVGFEPTIFKE